MKHELFLKLPAGPIDIVGDVHGHLKPLQALIEVLGYDERGQHPQGRRLVFVGDLCDRGPNSPGVFDLVMQAVEEGGAVCLLGNHELALIDTDENERQKAGNAWFFGNEAKSQKDEEQFGPFELVRPGQRERIEAFCDSLPLAVVHPDVQIVHACWDLASLEFVGQFGTGPNRKIVEKSNARAFKKLQEVGLEKKFPLAKESLEDDRRRADWDPTAEQRELIKELKQGEYIEQRDNPVRVLTSGYERPSDERRWLGQKWRFLDRVPWWNEAKLDKPTVFGHYWRQREHLPKGSYDQHLALFGTSQREEWLGPQRLAMCVDYWYPQPGAPAVLAAYRPDLGELVFCDGQRVESRWGRLDQ